MNIHDYIATGILEAYVLGELSERERAEVEKNLAQYPELREELARVEETQEKLLMDAAVAPKASVKTNLFAQIDKAASPKAKVVAMPSSSANLRIWKYAAAASVTIALIASFQAYYYWNKWRASETNLTELTAQNQRMAQDYNRVNQHLEKMENDLKVVDNPAFKRVMMMGTPNAPQSMAYVYWNESSKEVYLSIQSLKQLSKDNQYQLWAIIDGKPVDAGVFDGDVAGLLKMKDIASGAAAFAVTIEPRGGKTTPTLETMQVMGNVVKV
ncbi:anti-sigma factor [Chryseolinea soli]|uniref:Regulator of SigK n=1 Tax=Chryseolinea soli TaxID=2321403 RepID=A0A385SIW5_9BACT|nr:anti-sigma factor [Chryseolinea soli]AYB31189.1 anti-sigma factor [Chryseolinea soli]